MTRQGPRVFLGTTVAALAIAIVGAAPAAASRASCIDALGSKKANRFSESSKAIVLRRHGQYYGCTFRGTHIHKLPGQDDGGEVIRDSVQVEARNAAYGIVFSGNVTSVNSFQIGTNHLWVASQDPRWNNVMRWGEDVTLDDLVLRPNGSIAWQFSWPRDNPEGDDSFTVVLGFDHNGSGRARFDGFSTSETNGDGRPIRGTLDLLHDGLGTTGWGVRWSRQGAAPTRHSIN